MAQFLRLDQLANAFPTIIIGFIIGAGGLNEWSIIGMAAWVMLHYTESWTRYARRLYWQDIIIFSISLLCILQWSYNDPALGSDDSGLIIQELLKICAWLVFSLSMVRTPKKTFYKTINGIGLGIGLFVLSTTIGALVTQPFQGSRGPIFNIFTGQIDAGSTFVAYSCIASTLLLLITRSSLAWLGSATCITLGIQSINRHSLIVGVIVFVYLTLELLFYYSPGEVKTNNQQHKRQFTSICIIIIICGLSLSLILSNSSELSVIERFIEFGGSDVRFQIYRTGYFLLGKSIMSNSFELLQNVNQQVAGFGVAPVWWHSLPLDSARSSGWLGLIFSVIWIVGILVGIMQASVSKGKYILVGALTLLTLLTSIPVSLGSYELLGSLALTQAIISSDKV